MKVPVSSHILEAVGFKQMAITSNGAVTFKAWQRPGVDVHFEIVDGKAFIVGTVSDEAAEQIGAELGITFDQLMQRYKMAPWPAD